jgi:tungstate transport system ATP-binding protein
MMSNTDELILRASNVSRNLNSGKVLLDNVSFEVKKRDRLVIVGPSGAGKTTLLRLLSRLDEASSGKLFFHGTLYSEIPPTSLRRSISMVFQEPAMFEGSVEYNLRIHEKLGFRQKPFPENELLSVLKSVKLPPEFLNRDTMGLSTGETKRVALARALLGDPEIMLLDEPTANLDPTSSSALISTLIELTKKGLTLIPVLHQVEHAKELATRVILLSDGKIIENSNAEAFFQNPKKEITRRFLSGDLE